MIYQCITNVYTCICPSPSMVHKIKQKAARGCWSTLLQLQVSISCLRSIKFMWLSNRIFKSDGIEIDEFGIRRQNAENAVKYKNRVFKCNLCGWAHSIKSRVKALQHENECTAMWIFDGSQKRLKSQSLWNLSHLKSFKTFLQWNIPVPKKSRKSVQIE